MPRHRLRPGTVVDQYVIEKTAGGGGFSIVYLAIERDTGRRVVIKEYMPGRLARRKGGGRVEPRGDAEAERFNRGRLLFIEEAKTLASLHHDNIVHVLNFFRANGTVYMVMAYEDGKNLQSYIKRHRGRLSERFLMTVFPPLLDALHLIHERGLLHLDIKPGNIHLRPGGRPLLLDFGTVHRRHRSRRDRPGHVLTHGFSAIELYEAGGYVGPWTDIYAIGATLRTCMEGRPPPPAPERHERDTLRPAVEAFRRRYPAHLLEAVDWALEVDPLLRPQRVPDLLAALTGMCPTRADVGQRAAGGATAGGTMDTGD